MLYEVITDPPQVETGVGPRDRVDLRQIVAEGVRPFDVEGSKGSLPLDPGQILDVGASFRILDQQEEFLRVSERERFPPGPEGSCVQGASYNFV